MERQRHNREDNRDDRHRSRLARCDRPGAELPTVLNLIVGEGPGFCTEEQLDGLAAQQRQADRDDNELERTEPPCPQRTEQTRFQARAERGAHYQSRRRSHHEVEAAPRCVEVPGDHRAEGDQLAVGEVDQAGGSVDDRQADCAHGDDHSELQTCERPLGEALRERRGSRGVADREHHRP